MLMSSSPASSSSCTEAESSSERRSSWCDRAGRRGVLGLRRGRAAAIGWWTLGHVGLGLAGVEGDDDRAALGVGELVADLHVGAGRVGDRVDADRDRVVAGLEPLVDSGLADVLADEDLLDGLGVRRPHRGRRHAVGRRCQVGVEVLDHGVELVGGRLVRDLLGNRLRRSGFGLDRRSSPIAGTGVG